MLSQFDELRHFFCFLMPERYLLRSFVVQRSTDGCAEFGVLGNMEMDAIELLKHRIDLLALGQEGQVANEYEVLDTGIEG